MRKLDFKHFKVYTGISRKAVQSGDIRESFADLLYRNVPGIRSHALALKIYQSEGETGYTNDEVELIVEVANKLCLPNVIDGLNEQLDNGKENP